MHILTERDAISVIADAGQRLAHHENHSSFIELYFSGARLTIDYMDSIGVYGAWERFKNRDLTHFYMDGISVERMDGKPYCELVMHKGSTSLRVTPPNPAETLDALSLVIEHRDCQQKKDKTND